MKRCKVIALLVIGQRHDEAAQQKGPLSLAEAALVGMTKDNSTEFRGDPKKAIEWLDKVAESAPDTDWGKDAKKFADELRNLNTQDQVVKLQTSVYSALTPSLPGFDPKMPRDPTHGFPGP